MTPKGCWMLLVCCALENTYLGRRCVDRMAKRGKKGSVEKEESSQEGKRARKNREKGERRKGKT